VILHFQEGVIQEKVSYVYGNILPDHQLGPWIAHIRGGAPPSELLRINHAMWVF